MNNPWKCDPCRCSCGFNAGNHFSQPGSAARAAFGLGDLLSSRFLGVRTPAAA